MPIANYYLLIAKMHFPNKNAVCLNVPEVPGGVPSFAFFAKVRCL